MHERTWTRHRVDGWLGWMGTTVSVIDTVLSVEPGSSVSTVMRVRNTGDVVDEFTFQPLGDAAAWISVAPSSIRLFPGTDESVTVSIAPPRRADSAPGIVDWAVRAVPKEDPDASTVVEGTVDIAMFTDVDVEMQPEIGHGRTTGRFELAVDNRGNIAVPVRITGTDSEQALEFDITPAVIDCEPGTTRFAKVKVKPAKRLWRGAPKTHPFELLAEPQLVFLDDSMVVPDSPAELPPPDGAEAGSEPATVALASRPLPVASPMTVTGTYVQTAILPKWFWKAVLAALALLLLLWILWQTLFKPTIESAAREIAVDEVAEVQDELAAIDDKVDAAAVADAVENQQTDDEIAALEETVADDGAGSGALGNVFNETTEPSNFRLAVTAAPGAVGTTPSAGLAADTTFTLTDVILQNPRGDLGIISIQLGGVPIIESTLGSFRDLDFHFVAPFVSDSSTPLSVVVECDAVQIPADGGCSPAVSFSGFETTSTPAGG